MAVSGSGQGWPGAGGCLGRAELRGWGPGGAAGGGPGPAPSLSRLFQPARPSPLAPSVTWRCPVGPSLTHGGSGLGWGGLSCIHGDTQRCSHGLTETHVHKHRHAQAPAPSPWSVTHTHTRGYPPPYRQPPQHNHPCTPQGATTHTHKQCHTPPEADIPDVHAHTFTNPQRAHPPTLTRCHTPSVSAVHTRGVTAQCHTHAECHTHTRCHAQCHTHSVTHRVSRTRTV